MTNNQFVELKHKQELFEKIVTYSIHECKILYQGALAASEEISYYLEMHNEDKARLVAVDLSGMLHHAGIISTNLQNYFHESSYSFSIVNIQNIVQRTKEYYRWFANNRDIEISINHETNLSKVFCDEERIWLAMCNLLHFSIRSSLRGKIVHIDLSTCEENYKISFSYISRKKTDNFLHPLDQRNKFNQQINDFRHFDLGISSIVKIIEKHNGKIITDSSKNSVNFYLNRLIVLLPFNNNL